SRGAVFCVFIDESRHAEEAVRRNVSECGFGTRADVFRKRFPAVLEFLRARKERFDLVLVDPPYGKETIYPILKTLVAAEIFASGAVVAAEHEAGDPVRADVLGVRVLQEKRYGSTAVTFLEM
ncbi:MAG: RsmD family RNA methyltransferase, partial [Candidatus Methylomirabilis sp.]|nr:RsmD family RNA methyltransferase [Deltaproteobacteria bacterium]